jgi:hypothetical protein
MKNVRLSATLSAALMLTCLSLNLWPQEVAAAPQLPFLTGTYIITNTDSSGAFVSRGLIAFNADRTLSVVDSKQGVTPSFSNQLGTWGFSSTGILAGRTIDFDFPPPDDNLVRLDWTFRFGPGGSISGTVTLYSFPLTANPNDGGGTFLAKYTFTGYKMKLP